MNMTSSAEVSTTKEDVFVPRMPPKITTHQVTCQCSDRQTVDLHGAGGERGAQAAAVTGSAAVHLRTVNMQQIASDATT